MRWDNLLAGRDDDGKTETAVLPLFAGEAIVRRFKTPQFRGMTFYEVAAKSIINHVPGDRFGFRWTINPFRGCSHACTYCLHGDTPILLATGRTKPLAEVRPGDEIHGTAMTGLSRRYVTTVVSDHWSAVKPAYRVTLGGGTELVTSGDHRFLTEEGWRHVAGPGENAAQASALTPGIRLVGTGKFPEAPLHDEGYRRGYVRGLFAREAGPDRRIGFDLEAEERVRAYLRAGLGPRQEVEEDAGEIDGGRPLPARQFRGFLAGVYDATGSYSDAVRLEPEAGEARVVCRCPDELGFRWHQDELKSRPCIRLAGGREAWPRVVSVEPLGVDLPLYDITTGTGDFIADGVVSHNCFARPTHTYLDFDAGRDFETKIVVKVNAAELLRRELRRASWKGELIAMGTNTDPYQRAEGHYKLMRGILGELNAARNPYSILTKGTLIQRDLDLLVEGASVTEVSANFSVGTVDEKVWETSEPGTPHPMKRLEVVKMLNDAGIPCGVLMAPILPGISDRPEQLEATVKAAAEAGATHVTPLTLHLRPGVKEEFLPWLAEHHPELVSAYGKAYRRSYAPKEITEPIGRQVAELRGRHGVARTRPSGGRGGAPPTEESPTGPMEQGSAQQGSPEQGQGPAQTEESTEQMSLDLGAAPPRKAPPRTAIRSRPR
ncbi:MAG: radical SAM protein [Actinobacteria bacterium]|nr:MAG: radical SAM protein [Actinomycetota bacterium]